MKPGGWHPLNPCVWPFPCVGERCPRKGAKVKVGELRSGAWNAARNNWDGICEHCYYTEMQQREHADDDDDDATEGREGDEDWEQQPLALEEELQERDDGPEEEQEELQGAEEEPAAAAGLLAGGAAAAPRRGRNILEQPQRYGPHRESLSFTHSETRTKLHELVKAFLLGVPRAHTSGCINPAPDGTTHRQFLEKHQDTLPECHFEGPSKRAEAVLEECAMLMPMAEAVEKAAMEFAIHKNVTMLLVKPELFFFEECRHDPLWMVQPNAVAGTGGGGVRIPCLTCKSNKFVNVGGNGWNMTRVDRVRCCRRADSWTLPFLI